MITMVRAFTVLDFSPMAGYFYDFVCPFGDMIPTKAKLAGTGTITFSNVVVGGILGRTFISGIYPILMLPNFLITIPSMVILVIMSRD
jgi:hypothetical protein